MTSAVPDLLAPRKFHINQSVVGVNIAFSLTMVLSENACFANCSEPYNLCLYSTMDMENSETKLTALQFKILDGMADDYEDVEQLYLYANRKFADEKQANVQFPQMVVEVRFPLRDIVDEMVDMLREGYIFAKYSNDEKFAPLCPLNFALLHHYWFGATDKGTRSWKEHAADEASTQ